MGTPMIDDLELKAVQQIRQETEQDFVQQRIAGLPGTLHQKLGRRSHRVSLCGALLPETATDELKKLQEKATSGDEVTFTADITTALKVQKMVIESFRAEQFVGPAGQVHYAMVLAESPPLPPPAEVSAFGGLGDFGLGDMGFDTDALSGALDSISEQAGALMDAADTALDAVQKLESLTKLADIGDVGNPIKPLTDKVGELSSLPSALSGLSDAIGALTG